MKAAGMTRPALQHGEQPEDLGATTALPAESVDRCSGFCGGTGSCRERSRLGRTFSFTRLGMRRSRPEGRASRWTTLPEGAPFPSALRVRCHRQATATEKARKRTYGAWLTQATEWHPRPLQKRCLRDSERRSTPIGLGQEAWGETLGFTGTFGSTKSRRELCFPAAITSKDLSDGPKG